VETSRPKKLLAEAELDMLKRTAEVARCRSTAKREVERERAAVAKPLATKRDASHALGTMALVRSRTAKNSDALLRLS
jgi:hypothetical protein